MKNGFTLIELLVVVLIIGILAAVALPQYNNVVARARVTEMVTMVNAFQKRQDMFRLREGRYIPDLTELEAYQGACGALSGGVQTCNVIDKYTLTYTPGGNNAYTMSLALTQQLTSGPVPALQTNERREFICDPKGVPAKAKVCRTYGTLSAGAGTDKTYMNF